MFLSCEEEFTSLFAEMVFVSSLRSEVVFFVSGGRTARDYMTVVVPIIRAITAESESTNRVILINALFITFSFFFVNYRIYLSFIDMQRNELFLR